MIGLDTNVLARYYVQDESDAETLAQHEAARRIIEAGTPLMVSKTVLLELEWVMRGYYEFSASDVLQSMHHLLALPHVTIEDRESVMQALSHCSAGLDFADALHLASYRSCQRMLSFDDKKFARKVQRLGLSPRVVVPK